MDGYLEWGGADSKHSAHAQSAPPIHGASTVRKNVLTSIVCSTLYYKRFLYNYYYLVVRTWYGLYFIYIATSTLVLL